MKTTMLIATIIANLLFSSVGQTEVNSKSQQKLEKLARKTTEQKLIAIQKSLENINIIRNELHTAQIEADKAFSERRTKEGEEITSTAAFTLALGNLFAINFSIKRKAMFRKDLTVTAIIASISTLAIVLSETCLTSNEYKQTKQVLNEKKKELNQAEESLNEALESLTEK